MSDASDQRDEGRSCLCAFLAGQGVKQAVDYLPYNGREGGFQYTQGPEVEDMEELRDLFPTVGDGADWEALESKLMDMGPWFRDDGLSDWDPTLAPPLKIKRWIRDGNEGLSAQGIDTQELLLESAGGALDSACSHDIMGEILFEGDDGKFYVGCVEFSIAEANPDVVKEALEEEADETDGA